MHFINPGFFFLTCVITILKSIMANVISVKVVNFKTIKNVGDIHF